MNRNSGRCAARSFIACLIAAGALMNGPSAPVRAASPIPPPEDAAPGARTAFGRGDILYAWLVKPTATPQSGPVGDGPRAAALRVKFRDGRTAEAALPPGQYFEDLEPRLADVDGDGRDEVLVVRIRPDKGASLALYADREGCDDGGGGGLGLLAETRPVLQPEAWLNPVGVADFDGDGKPEIALVSAPHADGGGALEIYRFADGRLVKAAQAAGYANHVMGSPILRLSAIVDLNGDGLPDIVLPTSDRQSVAVVSFAGGTLRELRREALPSPAAGAFSVIAPETTGAPKDRPPEVWVGLENGERFIFKAF